MSQDFTAPKFPIITWQTDFSVADYAVRISGTDITGTPVTINLSNVNVWGFNQLATPLVTGDCAPTSLGGWLRDQINAVNTGTDVVASYSWPTATASDRGVPATVYSRSSGNPITVEFLESGVASTTLANLFGFSSDNFTITAFGPVTNFNSCCYWSPYPMYTTRDLRNYIDPVFITENSDGSTVEAVRWGSRKTTRLLQYPTVYAADIYTYRRNSTGFATPAGRSISDPNNLLEELWLAAAAGKLFRVYSAPEVYREAYMTDQDRVRKIEDSLEDISARGAMFEVSLLLRDIS